MDVGDPDSKKNTLDELEYLDSVQLTLCIGKRIYLLYSRLHRLSGDIANLGATTNIVSRNEHVPVIERHFAQ